MKCDLMQTRKQLCKRFRSLSVAGFTFIELIIVLAILAIVAAIGAPSFGQFVRSGNISAATNDLVGALYSARSSAITRGVPTVVCPSVDPLSPDALCATNTSWSNGFIAFVDEDGNGLRNLAVDALLVQIEPLTNGIQLNADGVYSERVFFSNDGSSTNISGVPLSGQFLVEFGGQPTRQITVTANGRVSTETIP